MAEPARVVHVVKGLEANSGVAVFVSELAREQAAAGLDVAVLCDYRPELAPPPPVRLAVGRPLSSADAGRGDLVHVHALWSLFCLRALLFCRLRGIRYVVSPHGSLMPRVFSRGRVKKALVWRLLLRPLVRRAALVHCTSEAEADACRALGIDGPFVVAPLGVRLPERIDPPETKGKGREVLFLGRLGEEKGLFTLMDAWERVRPAGWRLKLAGPDWDGFAEKLRRRAAAFADSVEFVGEAGPEEKDLLYREADIFVLPSPLRTSLRWSWRRSHTRRRSSAPLGRHGRRSRSAAAVGGSSQTPPRRSPRRSPRRHPSPTPSAPRWAPAAAGLRRSGSPGRVSNGRFPRRCRLRLRAQVWYNST